MSIGKDTLATSNTEKSATSEEEEMRDPDSLGGRAERGAEGQSLPDTPCLAGVGEWGRLGRFQSSYFYMSP